MKKFLSLLISASFLAAAPLMAFEKPSATESDQFFASQNIDDFEVLLEGDAEISQAQEEDPRAIIRRCPRGFRLTPIYRYNPRIRRWMVVGYRCTRIRYPIPPREPRPRIPRDPIPPRTPLDSVHHHAPLSEN